METSDGGEDMSSREEDNNINAIKDRITGIYVHKWRICLTFMF